MRRPQRADALQVRAAAEERHGYNDARDYTDAMVRRSFEGIQALAEVMAHPRNHVPPMMGARNIHAVATALWAVLEVCEGHRSARAVLDDRRVWAAVPKMVATDLRNALEALEEEGAA